MKQVLRWLAPMVLLGVVALVLYWGIKIEDVIQEQPEKESQAAVVQENLPIQVQQPPEENLPLLIAGHPLPGDINSWPNERYARITEVTMPGEEYVVEWLGDEAGKAIVTTDSSTLLRVGRSWRNDEGAIVSWSFDEISLEEFIALVETGTRVTVAYPESLGEKTDVKAVMMSVIEE